MFLEPKRSKIGQFLTKLEEKKVMTSG